MKTPSAPITDALLAVSAYKSALLVDAQRRIVAVAKRKPYFSADDLPTDWLAPEHRQGIASNAFNALRACEVIERLPLMFNDPERDIFAGRSKNGNPGAKGRWVACYRLASLAKAEAWLRANPEPVRQPSQVLAGVQEEMFA